MWQEQEIHDCVSAFDPLVANLDSVALPLKKMRAAKLCGFGARLRLRRLRKPRSDASSPEFG